MKSTLTITITKLIAALSERVCSFARIAASITAFVPITSITSVSSVISIAHLGAFASFTTFGAFTLLASPANAQQTRILNRNIRTVRHSIDGSCTVESAPTIISLNGNESVSISFDEMSHDYHRYCYKVEHCDANWNLSDLSTLDYIKGFDSDRIETYSNSINTAVDYTHYSFTLPNEETRFAISGNYRITVYDDDDNPDTPVFTTCIMVAENSVGITASMSSDTDIDHNKSHQQISATVSTSSISLRNAQQEVQLMVMQNGRSDNMAIGVKPTYIMPSELRYEHNRSLIFDAGNEYRRFETVTLRQPGMHVEEVKRYGEYYHATVFTDAPRLSGYSYDQDINGGYVLRAESFTATEADADTEADYVVVHFALETGAPLPGHDVYIIGGMTYNLPTEDARMTYNPISRCYEGHLLLKQGSYNYMYMLVPTDGGAGTIVPTEGSYHDTENEYTLLVYYRPFGARYDRLVGSIKLK